MRKTLLTLLFLGSALFTAPAAIFGTPTYEEWQEIAPFLLPDTHPVKPKLDAIFQNDRASASIEALQRAGFQIITKGHWSNTVIAKHPALHGFFIKLFTDDQGGVDDIRKLSTRIKGALLAEKLIQQNGWQKIFKVPRKWLYVLPELDSVNGKSVILIAEDMHILKSADNRAKWKSKSMNKKKLQAVFSLITHGGFNDSVYPFNLPFAKDGKIAVIDTEKYQGWPIPYKKLAEYLSPPMQTYWSELIIKGS